MMKNKSLTIMLMVGVSLYALHAEEATSPTQEELTYKSEEVKDALAVAYNKCDKLVKKRFNSAYLKEMYRNANEFYHETKLGDQVKVQYRVGNSKLMHAGIYRKRIKEGRRNIIFLIGDKKISSLDLLTPIYTKREATVARQEYIKTNYRAILKNNIGTSCI